MRVLAMLRKSYANSSIRHLPARSNADETTSKLTTHQPTATNLHQPTHWPLVPLPTDTLPTVHRPHKQK